jgi:hypothetical protein
MLPELQLAIYAARRAVPALRRTDIHLLAQAPKELSQKIEFVFTASPETIRGEPLEWNSFAQSANGGTCQTGRCVVLFLCRRRRLCCRAPALFCRREVALLTVYRQQVRSHLPRHGRDLLLRIAIRQCFRRVGLLFDGAATDMPYLLRVLCDCAVA